MAGCTLLGRHGMKLRVLGTANDLTWERTSTNMMTTISFFHVRG